VDGAMSYAMVWVNGKLSGGWPYGYNSWRVDLTPYLNFGGENQIAIRLDNPISSSRWYPGAGIYRNVWLTKTNAVKVAQWGAFISTTEVSKKSANINLKTTILNQSKQTVKALASTQVFSLDKEGQKIGNAVSTFDSEYINIFTGESGNVNSSTQLSNPKLWGPPPTQQPNRYIAVTTIKVDGNVKDVYETPFGIRELNFNPDKGIFVNGEKITIKGVDMHHDLGALGEAFNVKAAERQLQMLPMAHILPHWNWSDRLGLVTPVHVFTSGDEAELFLNGKSLGRKKKGEFEYRLSWDDVKYKPGELKVIAYKNGKQWAEDAVKTTQKANNLNLEADQTIIRNNVKDLSFITLKIADVNGNTIPNANQRIKFSIEGPGEIVATDNGDPTDLTSFASLSRNVFNGFCLVMVRSKIGESGEIKIKAESDNLISDSIIVQSVK
jgi:hypothetical protein